MALPNKWRELPDHPETSGTPFHTFHVPGTDHFLSVRVSGAGQQVYRFSFPLEEWEQIADAGGDIPGLANGNHNWFGFLKGNLFAIRASDSGTPSGPSTLFAYNVGSNSWSALAPTPDTPNGVAILDGDIWAGARSGDKLYKYTPETNTWFTVLTTRPDTEDFLHRWPMAGGNGKLWFLGGHHLPTGPASLSSHGIVHSYNPATNIWENHGDGGASPGHGVWNFLNSLVISAGGHAWFSGGHNSTSQGEFIFGYYTFETGEVDWAKRNSSGATSGGIPVPAGAVQARTSNLIEYKNQLYMIPIQKGGGVVTMFQEYGPAVPMSPSLSDTSGEGAQVFPAPEKLPHVITLEDTQGNPRLQRKLQENFESVERQLLALDPDQESADPQDR